jgi:S-formylglutathione hydrolase FrmB
MMRAMRHAPAAAAAAAAVLVGLAACGPSPPTRLQTQTEAPPRPATASKSRIETKSFASAALGVEKDYVVYLPAGYDDDPTRRYPVFYYLHGLTGDETMWAVQGALSDAANQLALQAIVIMPDGDDGFYADAATDYDYEACLEDGAPLLFPDAPKHKTCVKHRKYETYIVDDLIGHVDATYRTIASRDGRAIAGLSMGGLGAFEIGLRHKDRFAAIASHSGFLAILYVKPHPYEAGKVELLEDASLWGRGLGPIGAWVRGIYGSEIANWRAHDPAALVQDVKPGEIALYIDCGTEDGFLFHDHAAYLHDILVSHNVEHAYFLGPGGHDFGFWRPRLPESLAFLAARVTPPRP